MNFRSKLALAIIPMGMGCASSPSAEKCTANSDEYQRTAKASIKLHLDEVRSCFQEIIVRDRSLSGEITVLWILGSDGVPTKTKIKDSTMNSHPMENCVLEKASTWTFPKGSCAGLEIVHPFKFGSTE